ncbi:MAG: hypothetical protein CMIDDMOC_00718 [Sodalis sp. Fle]|nr:MAG: hypothetical protein CMIDDMOC_00718 [Sodalis sp. Fle]
MHNSFYFLTVNYLHFNILVQLIETILKHNKNLFKLNKKDKHYSKISSVAVLYNNKAQSKIIHRDINKTRLVDILPLSALKVRKIEVQKSTTCSQN